VIEPARRFEAALAASWPPADRLAVPVVLAVSGGADSVALLRGMVSLREQAGPATDQSALIVAHLNHGLRGADAEEDARFVADLAARLGLPVEIGRADTAALADAEGDGLEAAARQARYRFCLEVAQRHSARYVATGHTADDQAETILLRIVRGTGIRGLAGMPRARPLSPAVSLIRPLRGFRRRQVAEYRESLGQAFREDAGNQDPRFTRNRVRHGLLPLLAEQYNRRVDEALLRLGGLADEVRQVVDAEADRLRRQCVRDDSSGGLLIDCAALSGESEYLIREFLIALWREQSWPRQAMGRREWQALADLARGPAENALTLPGNILAKKEGNQLLLIPLAQD